MQTSNPLTEPVKCPVHRSLLESNCWPDYMNVAAGTAFRIQCQVSVADAAVGQSDVVVAAGCASAAAVAVDVVAISH